MAGVQRVGFIGLGTMGKPMAKRVLQGGYPLTVFDVVKAPVDELADMGANAAASPREVAQNSDVVCTILPNSPHVEQVVLGKDGVMDGLKPGGIVVEMSTIEPAVTRKVAAEVVARGGRMIDAPVGKGAAEAAQGTLTIMVGGDYSTFEEVKPILATMGDSIFHCGDIGAGITVKVVNNLMASVIIAAISEGLTLGVKGGVKVETLLEVISTSGARSFHLTDTFPKRVLSDNVQPGFLMDLMHKDLSVITATGSQLGVPLPVTNVVRELSQIARQKGLGRQDWTTLIKVYEEWAGVQVRLGAES